MLRSDVRSFATSTARLIVLAALVWGAGIVWVTLGRDQSAGAETTQSAQQSASQSADLVARGQYLVTVGGCNDCHTPWIMTDNGPGPDMSRMLSGHPQGMKLPPPPRHEGPWLWSATATNTAFAGPWGISYTANLTPDELTGIGIWTEEMFIKTLRTGKHWGEARPINPPMPWFNYGKMTDQDLKAIYAYLRSIPPVKNLVPDYIAPEDPAEKQ